MLIAGSGLGETRTLTVIAAVIGEKIRKFGLAQGYTHLSTLFLGADEYTGWACASMASHILSGQAVYRFSYGDGDEYLLTS